MEDQGHAAAVSQLVEDTADHIREIIDSAQTARWNKRECEHLVLRLSIIRELLPRLPQDSELESPLTELGKALGEAHELVLFGAGSQAESFRRVNGRINSLQSLFPVIIASRLGRILPLDDHDGESSITLTGPPPSSSYASLQTQNADTMRKFGKILRDADLRPSFIASHHGRESITLTGPPPSSSYGSLQTQPYEIGESSQPWEMINALLSCREMSDQAMELKALKGVLIDANAEPIRLSYPFLSFITGNFSQEIGRGGFGIVYQGDIGTSKVAVKKLHISESFSDALFVDEIKCLIKAKHNNVVRFLGYCADTHGKLASFNGNHVMSELPHRLLCFEYVPNGDLRKYLKDKSHKDEWKIRYQMIRGICHGLSYLHGQRINHLDLKPANILLDAGMEPKITDFGLSRCFDEGVSRVYTKVVRGTMGCIAPETIKNGEITFKSDIYGLGIIIIKLLTRCNYYDFENWHTSLDMDHPQVKSWAEIAQTCVQSDQHKRPAIREIMQKLDEIESMR